MKHFNIVSAHAVMPVIVEYNDQEFHDIRRAVAYVNYGQDQVWFPNNPELDTDVMRRAVLSRFDTAIFPKEVHIPPEILEQVEQIRQGNYGHPIPNYHRS